MKTNTAVVGAHGVLYDTSLVVAIFIFEINTAGVWKENCCSITVAYQRYHTKQTSLCVT